MLIIGLTGGSGCGKSIVRGAFEALGAFSVDADAVYHAIVASPSACTKELSEAFGEDILAPSGALDRSLLAAKVFCGGEEEKKRHGIHLKQEKETYYERTYSRSRLQLWMQ